MARVRKSALAFDAITLEGSLISPTKLAEIADRKATEQTDADYHIPKGLTLRDETARYFRIGQALFRELFADANLSQQAAMRFTYELLRDVFGFTDIQPVTGPKEKDDRSYALHFEALQGRAPVVVVPPFDDLDHASTHLSTEHRRSAATAIQDWLNAEENALWGLCCNGEHLRLLRDNESLTRPAYIEANLRQLFEAEDFAGFAALWLMLHASRFGRPGTPVTDCALEHWREAGAKEGVTARGRLSISVKEALKTLGEGFLSHPANSALRDRLTQGQLPLPDFFNELLRLVYRLIFLLAAEDRDLLHSTDAPVHVRKLYADGYSLGALRDRAIRRSGWDQFHDRWEGLLIVFRALAHGEPRLGLPALGGLFDERDTANLNRARLSNRALMEAIFRLAWMREDSSILPVNWRDMETEELGSVYEGLLELTPRLTQDGRGFAFAEGLETKGNERKKTGSYYTPDSLVQTLLDSALDPVLDRVESEGEEAASALLGVTVIDPACGSGHFLLAAARRIATRVARARALGVPSAADYRHALRDVVRCSIHGVDRNPMAIELAKVALWIETVEPGKPLGFLEANLRLGDSLLGIFDLRALERGIPDGAYKPLAGDDKPTAREFERRNKADKGQSTRMLDFSGTAWRAGSLPPLAQAVRALRELPEDTLDQIAHKSQRFVLAQGDPRITSLHHAADLYIAAFLIPKKRQQSIDPQTSLVPTTEDVWTAMRSGTVYGPRLVEARRIAQQARAFHWPLEFPDVIAGGGFSVVLGNPPWERIKIQEQEFFASRESAISEAPNADARWRMISDLENAPGGSRERLLFEEFELAKRAADASSEFARIKAENGGRFPLTGRGDVNTYSLFAELFSLLINGFGRAGAIVPTGIATDATTASFFVSVLEAKHLIRLISFENEEFIFPSVHHAYRFCLLTVGKVVYSAPEFAFVLRQPEQLADFRRRFTLSPSEIAHMNPNTKTSPVFRSRYDAELTASIYKRVPVLVEEKAGKPGNPWGASLSTMFHMSNDSGLFRTPEQLSEAGFRVEGTDWLGNSGDSELTHPVYPEHETLGSTAQPEHYVPLYEQNLIHQYNHRLAQFEGKRSVDLNAAQLVDPTQEAGARYWVPRNKVLERIERKGWRRDWLIGWRRTARNTDIRSLLVTAMPCWGVGDSIFLVNTKYPAKAKAALLACLNSLTVDYVFRQKLSGENTSFYFVEQIPVLPPSIFTEEHLGMIVPRVLELTYTSNSLSSFALDLGFDGPPFTWNKERRAILRAELDAWYARAYGLNRDELRYILDPADVLGSDYPSETFRVLKNRETREYGEYRTRRLVLDAWDRMERGELPCPEPYDRNAAASHADLLGHVANGQSRLEFAEEPLR